MSSLVCGTEETKQMNKEKQSQIKNPSLNYREQAGGFPRGGGWGDGGNRR